MIGVSRVAIVKGNGRKKNILKALNLVEDDIEKSMNKKKSDILFVKINAIDSNFPLACTHPEAIEAVMEFFNNRFNRIIVGDNTYVLSQNGNPYTYLRKKFQIELSNLVEFGHKKLDFRDIDGGSIEAHASLLPEKAFTVSLALPKTHDAVVFTGCSKNMLGCILEGRSSVHGTSLYGRFFLNVLKSISTAHRNLAILISNVKPDLAVMDGFVGMEGEGPLLGSEIDLGLALASTDAVALDSLVARIVGLNTVPYLSMCSGKDLESVVEQTEIIKMGFENLEDISRKIKTHHLYKYQTLEKTRGLPIDLRFLVSVLRRPHRIFPKIMKMILR